MRFQGAHGRSPYCRDGQGGQEGEGEDHGRYREEGRELKEGEATPKAKEMETGLPRAGLIYFSGGWIVDGSQPHPATETGPHVLCAHGCESGGELRRQTTRAHEQLNVLCACKPTIATLYLVAKQTLML